MQDFIEVWYVGNDKDKRRYGVDLGWYYWYCQPGCLPDCDAIGPFKTEAEARLHAKEDDQ